VHHLAARKYHIKVRAFWGLCANSSEILYARKFIRVRYMQLNKAMSNDAAVVSVAVAVAIVIAVAVAVVVVDVVVVVVIVAVVIYIVQLLDLWSLPDHLFHSFWSSIASPTHVRTPCFDHPGSYASFLSEWVVTTAHTVISLRTIWFDGAFSTHEIAIGGKPRISLTSCCSSSLITIAFQCFLARTHSK